MDVTTESLPELGRRLMAERKRQGLSRAGAASVCNVSTSFIRDAENNPGRCSVAHLLQLVGGLGLSLNLIGLQEEVKPSAVATSSGVSEPR